jgi:hypothetical protein
VCRRPTYMRTCFSSLLRLLAVLAVASAVADTRLGHNGVGRAPTLSNDTIAVPSCVYCRHFQPLCCAEFRMCCGTFCCGAGQKCDVDGNCIDPIPPKPSKRLLWAKYISTVLNWEVVTGATERAVFMPST